MKKDDKYKAMVMKYRQNLLNYGQRVNLENPDRLTMDEMIALTEKIFSEVDKIDMNMGYEHHDTGIRLPASISREKQKEVFMDFIDWYQVVETPSAQIYDYVLKNYPLQNYPNILCVGDGENCHLGRKLAMQGYKVLSIDPLARKEFSGNFSCSDKNRVGKLRVVQGEFHKDSVDMINWSNLIVGAKVPLCVEDLVQVNKPTVFNISANPEMYNMTFKGVPIKSEEQFVKEIAKCQGVNVKEGKMNGKPSLLFVRDLREQER